MKGALSPFPGKALPLSKFSNGGLTADHRFYEKYAWYENNLFEDSGYEIEISKESFIDEIEKVKKLVCDTELSSWADLYDEILQIADSW